MRSHLPSLGSHVMMGVALVLIWNHHRPSWSAYGAQELFLLGQRQDNVHYQIIHDEKNTVDSIEKAKEILRRYGYLRCGGSLPPPNLYGRKKKPQNGVVQDGNGHPAWKGVSNQGCSEEAFRRALKQYQQTYNMNGTGALDTPTLRMMSESRCGNPDDDENIPPRPMFRTKRGKKLRKKLNRVHKQVRSKRYTILDLKAPDPDSMRESESRRKRWLEQRLEDLSTGVEDLRLDAVHRKYLTLKTRREGFVPRVKRSTSENSVSFPSEVITWRLVGSSTSEQLDVNTQRSSLALAFRMWGEVIPLLFYEDTKSPVEEVDILIAFGKGEHFNCPNNFDGFGGQLSHAVRAKASAEIHVDDDEHLTILGSDQGTNLVKVAVHEIGHALGLHHTSLNGSIMYAIYNKIYPYGSFELSTHDRRMIQAIYGICRGKFDSVFDWVRPRYEDGENIYNTYFFRDDKFWMYENKFNRPRYGDPLSIKKWPGLPDNIDAYVHVWYPNLDARYFFKGRQYWKYEVSKKVSPGYPRNISDDFGPISGSHFPSIPNHLDSVFFDQRDSNIYFFKGSLVYAYDPRRGKKGCCLPGYPKELAQEFPISTSNEDGDESRPTKPSKLPSNLDAVYYSYTDKRMYFFKGNTFYENIAFNPRDRRRINKLKGPKDMATKWHDICSVEL